MIPGRTPNTPASAQLCTSPYQRLGQEVSRVVGEVACGEVVGAVDDDVVGGEDAHRRLRVEVLVDRDHLDIGVQVAQRVSRRVHLESPDVIGPVEELALEVGGVDPVEVDHADLAHTGRGQVHARGRAETAGAQQQHAGSQQLALAGAPNLWED